MEYLIWQRKDRQFRWAHLSHRAICKSIDDMESAAQGMQAIYGRYSSRSRIRIYLMLPRCGLRAPLGLLDRFVDGSLIGATTDPKLKAVVELLLTDPLGAGKGE